MKRRSCIALIGGALGGALLGSAGCAGHRDPTPAGEPAATADTAPAKAAPLFSAKTFDEKPVSLSQFRGKRAVLLNFYGNY